MSNTALDGMTIGGTPGSGRWSVVSQQVRICASRGGYDAEPRRDSRGDGRRRVAAAGLR